MSAVTAPTSTSSSTSKMTPSPAIGSSTRGPPCFAAGTSERGKHSFTAVRAAQVAVYARVSSSENRPNLDRQAERVAAVCAATGWPVASLAKVVKVVKECGSGVNDQRPQFLALLADTSISHIVGAHTDRGSRFGVASIPTVLKTPGRERVIGTDAETGHEDVLPDVVAISTSCTARL